MSLSLDKSSIRKNLIQKRALLCRSEIEAKSEAALAHLTGLPAFRSAKTIGLYSPIRNEVETGPVFVTALSMGIQICYPSVLDDELHYFKVKSLEDLTPGCFGVSEPDRKSFEIYPDQIDLLVVPGVVFDHYGHRLGYGRGYFDRFLSACAYDGLSVGLCFDFQIIDRLPVENHDQQLMLLVSDKKVYSPLSL